MAQRPRPRLASNPTIVFEAHGIGIRWAMFTAAADRTNYQATIVECGLPLACLRTEKLAVNSGPPNVVSPSIDVSARFGELLSFAPHGTVQPRVVPAGVKMGGQFVNTLVVATIVVAAQQTARRGRRAWRRRHGLCLECGYDLSSTQSQCPECGVATPLTSGTTDRLRNTR